MRLKDLMEATFRLTMVSIHKHASGVTTSATTGNSAAAVPRGKQPLRDFGGNVLIDDGADTQAGDVLIDDGVDTQACDADSGITTSGTTGNSAAAVPRGKRPL